MNRHIVSFLQDEQGDWMAELECGHLRHVRHDPPWTLRPWIATPEGRAGFIGRELNCGECSVAGAVQQSDNTPRG